MILRDYQRAAIDSIYEWFRCNEGNCILTLPTGAGKSVIIGAFIREVLEAWPNQRVIMLTHVKELIEQNAAKLAAIWPEAPMGIYSASLRRRDIWDSIIFAGIQSVYKRAMELGRFDLCLIDECHLVNIQENGMYRQFLADALQINPALKIIGLTATPFRTGTGDITAADKAIFHGTAYEISILDLLARGHLAPLVSKRMATQIDTSGLHVRQGEFVQKEVEALVDTDELTAAALGEIQAYGTDRGSWLIFCAGVAHAEHVRDALLSRGIKSACVTGKTPALERARIIEDYKTGALRAVTNCDVLTTGFDAPATDLLAFLRPTHSPGLYVQMMGRGMRAAQDKANCLVLDFAGNVVRHGPVDEVWAWVPQKREKQDAPTKNCPDCDTIVAAQVRECPECGYAFPFEEADKHERTATDAAILSTDIDRTDSWVTYPVTGVTYARHEKPGKPPSVRVEYWAGLNQCAREWVCPEHGGIARAKAVSWFTKRSPGFQCPRTVDEFIECAQDTLPPSSIVVDERGKYPEIINYEWHKRGAESGHALDLGAGIENRAGAA